MKVQCSVIQAYFSAPVGASNCHQIGLFLITFGMYTFSQVHTRTRWIASSAPPLHLDGGVSPFPGIHG